MKYQNEEVRNISVVAKRMILKHVYYLLSEIVDSEFGGLEIRSEIGQSILKREQGFECSTLEADLLMKNLEFEIAKIAGKLENDCLHPKEHTVPRNNQGYITRQTFGL